MLSDHYGYDIQWFPFMTVTVVFHLQFSQRHFSYAFFPNNDLNYTEFRIYYSLLTSYYVVRCSCVVESTIITILPIIQHHWRFYGEGDVCTVPPWAFFLLVHAHCCKMERAAISSLLPRQSV